MRQIKLAPLIVVKGKRAGRHEVASLLKIASEAKVFVGITCMPKMKPPSEIQEQALPSGALPLGTVSLLRWRFGKCFGTLRNINGGSERRHAVHGSRRRSEHAGLQNIAA